jgi:hypothetical protein
MQILWGKVLAGEVKRPGSYSLRTLDLLKNITTKEAEVFAKVGQLSFLSAGKAFIPDPDNGEYLKENFGLQFTDFLLLREIDLLVANNLEFNLLPSDQKTSNVFICGLTCVLINRPPNAPKQAIKTIMFTEIGRELLQLLGKKPADPKYIIKFASLFRRDGNSIQSGLIIGWHGDQIRYINLNDVPDETNINKDKVQQQL